MILTMKKWLLMNSEKKLLDVQIGPNQPHLAKDYIHIMMRKDSGTPLMLGLHHSHQCVCVKNRLAFMYQCLKVCS